MSVHLRPYQREAVDRVKADWRQHGDLLGVLPTGGGKTIVFLQLLLEQLAERGGRALILAHRDELISQPVERLKHFWPEWAASVGIVRAEIDEPDRALTVASVQTLARPGRLERILAHGKVDYLIVDESHHAVASTYLDVWNRLREANPGLRHLGVTATPLRTDKRGLVQVYKRVVFRYSIRDLQQQGYLVPVTFRQVDTGISLASLAEDEGRDFDQKTLASVWECENLFDLVVESHKRWSSDRQAIAFTVTVEGAHRLAKAFQKAGVNAAAADGTTPRAEREAVLKLFRAGDLQVLCNCFLYTEGLDVPEVSAIHWLRPTKSVLVVTQGVGRALRPAPMNGKTDALVLFYAPVEISSLATPGDVLGEEIAGSIAEEDEEETLGAGRPERSKLGRGSAEDLVARPIELLLGSPLSWFPRDGLSVLGLGEVRDVRQTLAILPRRQEGVYVLVAIVGARGKPDRIVEVARSADYEEVVETGTAYAERHGEPSIFQRGRWWKASTPSANQLGWLRKLGVAFDERAISRGEASDLLTHAFARKSLARAGWTWSRPRAGETEKE